jgi:hypothetical protein
MLQVSLTGPRTPGSSRSDLCYLEWNDKSSSLGWSRPGTTAATISIQPIVVSMNSLVWRRLYHLAKTKYKLLG